VSDSINVQYETVFSTVATLHGQIFREMMNNQSSINQARSHIHHFGGAGNDIALMGLDNAKEIADILAEAVEHLLAAVASSARHLQAEEALLANQFDSLTEE